MQTEVAQDTPRKNLWRIKTLADTHDLSERTIYRLIASNNLEAVKLGRSVLITEESRQRWLASLPRKSVAA